MKIKRPSAKGTMVGLAIISAIGSFALLVAAYIAGYNRQDIQLASERRRDGQLLQLATNQEAQLQQLQQITTSQTSLLDELKAIAEADKALSEDNKAVLAETKRLSERLTQAVKNINDENKHLHGQILTAERSVAPAEPGMVDGSEGFKGTHPKSMLETLIEELLKG